MGNLPTPALAARTLELLDPGDRRRLCAVGAAAIAVAICETFGIASVMPFLSVVANPEAVEEEPWLARLWTWFAVDDSDTFLFVLGLLMLALILSTNVLSALSQWMIQRFTWQLHHRLSTRLLARFLRQPWSFYLNENTSELSARILSEVSQFVGGFLLAGMQLLAQSVATAAILSLLFLVDPILAAFVTVVIGGVYVILSIAVRKWQLRLGETRRRSNERRFRYAAEAMGGIKDAKANRLEDAFVNRYERSSREFSVAQSASSLLAVMPRYMLETLGVGVVMVVLLYELRVTGSASSVIPIVGLYTFAGFRLLPKTQLIYHSVSAMRFSAGILEGLRHDLVDLADDEEPLEAEPPAFESEFGLKQVTFHYPDASRPALSEVTLLIEKGSRVAVVGRTGSGKTTCVDLLLGLLDPEVGELVIDGRVISGPEHRAWRLRCGYVPQHVFISDDSVAANIALGAEPEDRDLAAIRRAAKIANLDGFIESELPRGYDTMVGERGVRLSGGQRQRLGIARAFYRDPDVVILDEATNALDSATESAILESVEDLAPDKTMIIVAHRLSTVRDCDRLFVLESGRLVGSGTWTELIGRCEAFRNLLSTEPRRRSGNGVEHGGQLV